MTRQETKLAAIELLHRFRRVPVVLVQLAIVAASVYAAFLLRFDGKIPPEHMQAFWQTLPWLLLIRAVAFLPFRLYEGLWRYTSVYDLETLVGAIVTSTLALAVYVYSPFGPAVFPRSVFFVDSLLLLVLLGGIRLTRRLYSDISLKGGAETRRLLVYGAGDAGQMIVREMRSKPDRGHRPIGFIDDDRGKVGRRIHGVPVLGSGADLAGIIKRFSPTEILIAIPGADPAVVRSIVRLLEPFKLPIKTLPNLRDLIEGRVGVDQIRKLAVEDLLARAPVGLPTDSIEQLLLNKRIIVTGAGGSIGSELCRQIATFHPALLVMLDRYENSLHEIRLELQDYGAAKDLRAVIADVSDEAAVNDAIRNFEPDIIFHAAAHKHVTLMEENPCEAVKNNVRGTRVLAESAERHGVDRFILISTDKAANPTSIMGSSKRVAEMVIQSIALGSATSFSIVRFGNVLGSNGSVVPRFLSQIRRGGPVTVTHPDVRRFFMLIPEAVQLVLHAASQLRESVTYVLDMGEQIPVADVARNLIRLAGLVPDQDIQIKFTGLKPGEKMEEELFGSHEQLVASDVPKVMRVRSAPIDTARVRSAVLALEDLASSGNSAAVVRELKALTGMPAAPAVVRPTASQAAAAGAAAAVAEASTGIDGLRCPNCGKHEAYRSRSTRFDHRIRKRLSLRRLHRCISCGWRGWLDPIEKSLSEPVEPVTSPDLVSLDTPAERPVIRDRSFSPKNLD